MVTSTWTAPLRRNGVRLLTPLPPDIYFLILDHFFYDPDFQSLADYKKLLIKLSLVCRFFHTLVVPKLFKEFALDGDDEFEAFGFEWVERAWEGDVRACDLLTHAKDLAVSNWRDDDNDEKWKYPSWREHFMKTFPRFSSLVQLHVLRTPLEHEFMEVIYKLPNLQILSIKECSFPPVTTLPQSRPDFRDRPLRLHEFQLAHVENFSHYIDDVANFVTTSALQVLKTSDRALIRKIMESGTNIPLQCLEVPIEIEDVALLSEFLTRCPTITDLWLEGGDLDNEQPSPPIYIDIPSSALPNLKVLHCPATLLGQLLPKRPIVTLNMVGNHDWMFANSYDGVDISALSENKAPQLEELVIPFAMYSEIQFHKIIPKIDTLVVCLPLVLSALPCRGILKALCIVHEQHPVVRHLKLHPFSGINLIWAFNLSFQHQLIIELLSISFPSATHISLNEGIEWRLVPETKEWKPVLLAPEIYRSLLGAGEETFWGMVNVKDFEMLFANLFEEEELTPELRDRLAGKTMIKTDAEAATNSQLLDLDEEFDEDSL
ncbi:hypothetical protein QCA50_011072 [Cerrena zonata]|uniref:F-box domain-containing protein n=1 Tax=Cerrena zonata TaxID=2478898 RepID=A0AAW0G2K0_9APHY